MEEVQIVGGFQDKEITQEDRDLVNNNKDKINSCCNGNYESFEIVKARYQIVGGTNYVYHLNAQPGNKKLTVKIFVPLPHTGEAPRVENCQEGFN